LLLTGTSPTAHAATQTVQAADAAEAWYSTAPISPCTTPLGCPPSQVPTSPYPANTLHVGVAGGHETARSYVVPDLSALPFDATVTSGRMTLPIATATDDGSLRPETATLSACLATQTVQDGTAGSTDTPPTVDTTACVPATYSTAAHGFTVDLTSFLSRWNFGTPNDGIALVPDVSKSGPTTTWHVTFNGKKSTAGAHISSQLSYTMTSEVLSPPENVTTQPPILGVPGPLGPPVAAVPPLPAPVPTPALAPPPQQRAVAVSLPTGYQYPAAFLLPLAFLAAAVFLFRLFTADPTPVGART
jgi:hypothetical protein